MAPFRFAVASKRDPAPDADVWLTPDEWDDFNWKTTFRVRLRTTTGFDDLGLWKILDTQATRPSRTALPSLFEQLPTHFIALAQSIDTYSRIRLLDPVTRRRLLGGIRDVCGSRGRSDVTHPAFEKSLVRFAEAADAYARGKKVLRGGGPQPNAVGVEFRFRPKLHERKYDVNFAFSRALHLSGMQRLAILIGKNGTGKTQLMAALARAVSGLEDARSVSPRPTEIRRVVAISYSAFDAFRRPWKKTNRASYEYRGLRPPNPKTDDVLERLILDYPWALRTAGEDLAHALAMGRQQQWRRAMESLSLGSALAKAVPESLGQILRTRSAGEQVVVMACANLLGLLRPGTLVLHDEPETHLHPALIAGYMRMLHSWIDQFDSFAIVGTHSPIPVQEVPSNCVRVLALIDNMPTCSKPASQVFAAPLEEVLRVAFRAESDIYNYRSLLRSLAKTHSRAQIKKILGGELGLGASLVLAELAEATDE